MHIVDGFGAARQLILIPISWSLSENIQSAYTFDIVWAVLKPIGMNADEWCKYPLQSCSRNLDNGWSLGRRHDVEHSNQYISHFIEENAIENVVWNRELSCFSFNMLIINSPMSVAKKLGVLISLHVTLWTIVYLNNNESLNKSCFMFINNNYLLWSRHTGWRHQMEIFSL